MVDITDYEVKRMTGFQSLSNLLMFVTVVCNAEIENMITTTSTITWFEEWMLYFEMVWGRTITRWLDIGKKYGINKHTALSIYRKKLITIINSRNTWPTFLSHEEDVELRTEKWLVRYHDKRVIMWDNTNINYQGKPTNPDLQRLTHSQYYGGNVAKAAVFLQLSGWLGSWELWLGAISDTEYFRRSGIIHEQEEFQKIDSESKLSFTNILDKGYRTVLAAWRAGGQLILQPFFAKSDRKFCSTEVLLSAAVASDRSGNERAVQRCKSSWQIQRGIHQRQDVQQFADLWLAWGYQCNFMYKPVH